MERSIDLENLKKEAKEIVRRSQNLKDLDRVFKKYLSKKGKIADLFASLKNLQGEERKNLGERANRLKKEIQELINKKAEELKNKEWRDRIKKEKLDVTRPAQKMEEGHLHPLTLIQREVEEIFKSMGFSVVLGSEVENEWYNFDALNIPKNHPARDMWDTFWLKTPQKLLLRTHTSPVQVRYMEKNQPPLRIIVPGRIFRNEATDSTHDIQFYQVEGLMVDENITAANFRAIIEEFLRRFFKTKVEIRLRPSYFPFTEPSFEIDARRKGGKWIELMGAGMVHPKVFSSSGLNPKKWQGFAFGLGMDRLAMIRHNIGDIRIFYSGDFRFLKQF